MSGPCPAGPCPASRPARAVALRAVPRPTLHLGTRLGLAGVLLFALSLPGLAQQPGGRQASFTFLQGFETTRNPEREPDREDERRSLATTDLTYELSSTTRRAALDLIVSARLVGATGDLDVGDEEGFEIDRPRLELRHRYTAPNAVFRTSAFVQRTNIGFLERLDLIDDGDGGIELPDDADTLEGSGFRTNARLRFAADFNERQPFGWGLAVDNSVLTYDEVEGSTLEDSTRTTSNIYGRFDLTPVLSLRAGLRYQLRISDDEDAQDTVTYEAVLTHRRAENGALRAGVTLAQPEGRDDRLTLFVGGTQEIDDLREFDFNIGATIGESGEARFVGLIDYRQALSRTTFLTARLNRQANDTNDNETTLDTAARVTLAHELTPRSGLDFGITYGARENFTTDEDDADLAISLEYSHDLTRDWALTVGASHVWRDETDTDRATSDRLFFNIGRSWQSRF